MMNNLYFQLDGDKSAFVRLVSKISRIMKLTLFADCIYNHRTTKTNQKYPSVNL